LGLGNIGPEAAMPVMEGKAMLFKEFGGVDAYPICLNTNDVDEIVATARAISPGFGGINLEDISAPRCFEIEERLKTELSIPVFHDDQHGTAIVVIAALMNALKIVEKDISEIKIVISGLGAAGIACTKILIAAGAKNIIGCDRSGALYQGRTEGMNEIKKWYADNSNPENEKGSLKDVVKGADFFLGVSAPGVLDRDDIIGMAPDPIVFALANPDPEVVPEEIEDVARIVATGRSDYINQINNVLCFPGIFRGALDCRATEINMEMNVAAAEAIAAIIPENELSEEYIIPSVFNKKVASVVAAAVIDAAITSGAARSTKISTLSR
jgi:malate dehydrogenase (oxaloacetate-decarboxylating)